MKPVALLLIVCTYTIQLFAQQNNSAQHSRANYVGNRQPLHRNPFIELPLGAIRADGWLKEMLVRQKYGATGRLDSLYPIVMNNRNGWLGGDGDQWERGPYWIDGLLPLAYILNDQQLIAKVKPWIEWSIKSQTADGYFGPVKDYPNEPGIQRNNSRDWWPKMVMLKVLKQYYSATNDQRVVRLMTNYFRYQLKELPKYPLDHWTFWARYRGGDNLMMVYWLYNITGDKFLLDLAELIHRQTFNYTDEFLNRTMLTEMGSIHCVNLAQGIKEPLIYYQQHPDKKYLEATNRGFSDLRRFNGMAHGMYGGDEGLHGNNPTQGSELCSAVEMMFSLESVLAVTGQVSFADHLEKIAFNALPAQVTDDFMARQYFQQANQVQIDRQTRNFDTNHEGTDVCYGLLTGYPCCTSNMHQGWPKFTQSLWFATPDNGIAALVYAPSQVDAYVGNHQRIHFKEETDYPFNETIRFTYSTDGTKDKLNFPLHLRIPAWCKQASIRINGKMYKQVSGDQVEVISREWINNDVVELTLPMHIFNNTWYENSVSVERGPLVYALKIGENRKLVRNTKDPVAYGSEYLELHPTTPWNYGLVDGKMNDIGKPVFRKLSAALPSFPWNPESAPVSIRVNARKIPTWKLYNGMTGPIPYSLGYNVETEKETEELLLIPYGCTNLRLTQFPVIPSD